MEGSELAGLMRRMDALGRRIARRRRRIIQLRVELVMARARRQRSLDLLETDLGGRPLRLTPLLWAVLGVLLALGAAFLTYVSALLTLRGASPGDGSRAVQLFALAALALTVPALLGSRRPGAGGSARAVLRSTTWVVGALSLAGLLAIALLRLSFS